MINYIKDIAIIALYFCGIGDDAELSYTYEEDM